MAFIFEYQLFYHRTLSRGIELAVKFGFIRLVTGICRAGSLQGLCLWLQRVQSSLMTYLWITIMSEMISGVIFRLKDQAEQYHCVAKLPGKHRELTQNLNAYEKWF